MMSVCAAVRVIRRECCVCTPAQSVQVPASAAATRHTWKPSNICEANCASKLQSVSAPRPPWAVHSSPPAVNRCHVFTRFGMYFGQGRKPLSLSSYLSVYPPPPSPHLSISLSIYTCTCTLTHPPTQSRTPLFTANSFSLQTSPSSPTLSSHLPALSYRFLTAA